METTGIKWWDRLLKHKVLLTLLICSLITFVCITINSKNSFLYKLQDCDDAQCFMTIARCMLRGDVLYKDVYEHKGIVLYFLYMIGHLIDSHSFIGVYLIELVSFFVFIFFSVKTLRLFCKSDMAIFCFAGLIAIEATIGYEFRAGGQCEEFVLPLIAISLYLAFSQVISIKERDLSKYSIIIGLCFAAAFWMKYTLTGFYIGFALGVLIIGVRNKDFRYVLKNGLYFLLGAIIGTLPVLLYFGLNNALYDLWDVYFYTMLFKYGKSRSLGIVKIIKQFYIVLKKGYVAVPLILWIMIPKKQIALELKLMGLLMSFFTILGCASGVLQVYTYECFRYIAIFGYIGGICVARHFVSEEMMENKLALENKTRLDRFVIRLNKNVVEWKKEWEEDLKPRFQSLRFSAMVCLTGIAIFIFLVWFPSSFRMYMSYELSDYPLYKMKEEITERVSDNPQILYFGCTDMGLFYLTDTYPMDKYFCAYTLYKPEDLDYYNKYIITGKADFVASTRPQDKLSTYGYQLIYEELNAPFVSDGDMWSYCLYARGDLVNK